MQYTYAHVKQYIEAKKLAWSPASVKSEQARLARNLDLINMKQPMQAYLVATERGLKSYAIKTLFIRINSFCTYLNKEDDRFARFMQTHAQLFKHVYQKERLVVTYGQAKEMIARIPDSQVRLAALNLLQTGMRANELLTYDGSGLIKGKGGKIRQVYNNVQPVTGVTYNQLYSALKTVGLKPHTLRKLAATELARAGLKEADLLEVMGWSNIATATSYLQPLAKDELMNRVKGVLK